ncbi:hypothetical protein JOM56_013053 [Amanita muscaria]
MWLRIRMRRSADCDTVQSCSSLRERIHSDETASCCFRAVETTEEWWWSIQGSSMQFVKPSILYQNATATAASLIVQETLAIFEGSELCGVPIDFIDDDYQQGAGVPSPLRRRGIVGSQKMIRICRVSCPQHNYSTREQRNGCSLSDRCVGWLPETTFVNSAVTFFQQQNCARRGIEDHKGVIRKIWSIRDAYKSAFHERCYNGRGGALCDRRLREGSLIVVEGAIGTSALQLVNSALGPCRGGLSRREVVEGAVERVGRRTEDHEKVVGQMGTIVLKQLRPFLGEVGRRIGHPGPCGMVRRFSTQDSTCACIQRRLAESSFNNRTVASGMSSDRVPDDLEAKSQQQRAVGYCTRDRICCDSDNSNVVEVIFFKQRDHWRRDGLNRVKAVMDYIYGSLSAVPSPLKEKGIVISGCVRIRGSMDNMHNIHGYSLKRVSRVLGRELIRLAQNKETVALGDAGRNQRRAAASSISAEAWACVKGMVERCCELSIRALGRNLEALAGFSLGVEVPSAPEFSKPLSSSVGWFPHMWSQRSILRLGFVFQEFEAYWFAYQVASVRVVARGMAQCYELSEGALDMKHMCLVRIHEVHYLLCPAVFVHTAFLVRLRGTRWVFKLGNTWRVNTTVGSGGLLKLLFQRWSSSTRPRGVGGTFSDSILRGSGTTSRLQICVMGWFQTIPISLSVNPMSRDSCSSEQWSGFGRIDWMEQCGTSALSV